MEVFSESDCEFFLSLALGISTMVELRSNSEGIVNYIHNLYITAVQS